MPTAATPRRSLFAIWHWQRWTWAVAAVLIPVAYALSIGPMEMVFDHLPPQAQYALVMAYRPLVLVAKKSEWSGNLLDWYVELWWDKE